MITPKRYPNLLEVNRAIGWNACLEQVAEPLKVENQKLRNQLQWQEERVERKPEAHSVLPEPGALVCCDNCAFTYCADHVTEDGYICPACAQDRLEVENQRLRAVLQAIVDKPEGRYSRDPVQYRDNVIADIQEKARSALVAVEVENVEQS